MLKIGDFSKLSRISIRMLRHYNDLGLLIPDHIDEASGYRYYSESKLPLANRINALKSMGFSLAVVGEILTKYNSKEALKSYLELKKSEVIQQADNINRQLILLESTLNRLGKDDNVMNYNVTLKEMPKRYVASLRDVIPCYEMEGTLWGKMMQEITPLNTQIGTPCYSLAIFHDNGYKESDVDIEIQISVQGIHTNTDNVTFKTIEPMEIASVTFKGGYENISEVNTSVANWISDNHYEFNGPMFNIYHVGPATEQNPENWITEVCYPVKKRNI